MNLPGVTKHIYDHEIRDILEMWNKQLKEISMILPQEYTEKDIISLMRKYYSHEWMSVIYKYNYYEIKDRYLKKRFGKKRYCMLKPEKLFITVSQYKKIMNPNFRKQYFINFNEARQQKNAEKLWNQRKSKIERIDNKITNAKLKTQQMTPKYIDVLIGLYERKNTSQKDKMYIMAELKKYYNDKVINFFFKVNDTELNKQLRWIAFYHLQSFNYQPRARRQKYMQVHTKNKKRKQYLKNVYPNEKYYIPQNPNELEYRIMNSKEQQIKRYDYFISHSSMDSRYVQELILFENKKSKNVFCDWINDADYLKRKLVCNATLKVIEARLEQSDAIIFVDSPNSRNSIWCKYELNYFSELNRPIYCIKVEDIESRNWDALYRMKDKWYYDPDYKKYSLV